MLTKAYLILLTWNRKEVEKMANNTATNVSTGKPNIAGAVFVGTIGSVTIPTDATTPLGEGYDCLGYVSEDGLENANEMTVAAIKAWGGAIVYRSLTELNDEFSLALIESENPHVLKNVYGDANVVVDEDENTISVDVKAEDPQEKVWIFELALRGQRKKRLVIPDGAVTSREPIVYNDEDAIAYGITVSAYPDSLGSSHKEYIA